MRPDATISEHPAGVAQLVERQLPKLEAHPASSDQQQVCERAPTTISSSDSSSTADDFEQASLTEARRLIAASRLLPEAAKAGILNALNPFLSS